MERSQVDQVVDLAAEIAGKADKIVDIVCIYTMRDEAETQLLDNEVEVGQGLLMIELVKHHLITGIAARKNC